MLLIFLACFLVQSLSLHAMDDKRPLKIFPGSSKHGSQQVFGYRTQLFKKNVDEQTLRNNIGRLADEMMIGTSIIEDTTGKKDSLLHEVARRRPHYFRMLLEQRNNRAMESRLINVENAQQETPLHCMIALLSNATPQQCDNVAQAVEAILALGADATRKNNAQKSPLDLMKELRADFSSDDIQAHEIDKTLLISVGACLELIQRLERYEALLTEPLRLLQDIQKTVESRSQKRKEAADSLKTIQGLLEYSIQMKTD